MFIFLVGTLICALAPSSTMFIIGRAIAGIALGGTFSGGLAIIAHNVPLRRRPAFTGVLGSIFGVNSNIWNHY